MPAPLDPNADPNAKRKAQPQPGDPALGAGGPAPLDPNAVSGGVGMSGGGRTHDTTFGGGLGPNQPQNPGLGAGGPAPVDPAFIGAIANNGPAVGAGGPAPLDPNAGAGRQPVGPSGPPLGAGGPAPMTPDAGWTPPPGATQFPDGSFVLNGERVGPPSMMTAEAGVVGGPSAAAGGSGNATPQGIQQAYQNALMQQLNPNAIDPASIDANPVVAAHRLATARGFDRMRQQMAERSAAEGTLGSGGFDSQVRGAGQQAAESNAAFSGQFGQHLWDQQRSELQHAIDLAQQAGQFDKAQALQLKLAQMQNDMQGNQLGFDYAQLGVNANRDALLAMLGLGGL